MILIHQTEGLPSRNIVVSGMIKLNLQVQSEIGIIGINKLSCDLVWVSGDLMEKVTIQQCSRGQNLYMKS